MRQNKTIAQSIPTPWGEAQTYEVVANGVCWVTTARHGGILVDKWIAGTILSDRALAYGFEWGDTYAFEEDEAWAAFVYEQPALYAAYCNRLKQTKRPVTEAAVKQSAKATLRRWFPDYFAA